MPPSTENKIVILESDHARRDSLRSMLAGQGMTTFCFENISIFLDNLPILDLDLVIVGPLHSDQVFRCLNALRLVRAEIPALVLNGDAAVEELLQANAFQYDFTSAHQTAGDKLVQHIQTLLAKPSRGIATANPYPLLVGNSQGMLRLKRSLREIALSAEPVLIRGETGSGKELIAKAIQSVSDRKAHPFVKVDPAGLLRSGAFFVPPGGQAGGIAETLLHVADSGTVLVKDIAGLAPRHQAELLMLVENPDTLFRTAGVNKKPDLRILAATSEDLEERVKKGTFRKDLYYRLNVIRVDIPGLQHRREDIGQLTDFFVDKYCVAYGRSHFQLAEESKAVLKRHRWRGNVRELEQLIRKIVIEGQTAPILGSLNHYDAKQAVGLPMEPFAGNLLAELTDVNDLRRYLKNQNHLGLKSICAEFMQRTEKKLMKKALERTNWNRKQAASMLDISYKSMLNKIKAYKLA